MNELTITAEISKKGEIGLYQIREIESFGKMNKGKKLLVKYFIQDEDYRKRLLAYYFGVILDIWQIYFHNTGVILSKKQIDTHLRNECPITQQNELSKLELNDLIMFLDYMKELTLKQANRFIENPRLL